ncbi:MAG: AMP-binding protein [Eubacteriales bacterium]|nr:AMP-binding protein [Eubacteriales bacterium]
MKSISMIKALQLCGAYQKMALLERKTLQEQRLCELVRYAKAHSPYFAELYAELPEHFTLSDLPITNKRDLMECWNDWITDRSVTLENIEAFLRDKDNIGRKWKKKYMVVTTSGSTGNPLVMLCDSTVNNVLAAVSAKRAYARKEDMKAFIRQGGKSIGVYADSGFYLGNSTIRAKQLMMPWKKRQIGLSSALYATEKIVEQLNRFQPAMLGGYPSNLELLIEEQESGRLNISPVIIMTGGEYLSDSLRKRLAETFHCYVQTSYACTEGGTIACECRKKHLHINDDWLIVEPIDRDGNPVPDGQRADKLLLTNLYNYTQPIIRYEVADRIILHQEPCPCGNPSPWLQIEGRNDDVLTFEMDGKRVHIPPLAIYAELKEVHELRRFQLLKYHGNKVELRIEPMADTNRIKAFEVACGVLKKRFSMYGVEDVTVTLSEEIPRQHPISGKFKHIINIESSL